MARAEFPDDRLAAVQADFEAAADPVLFVAALRGGRASADAEYDALAAGTADLRSTVAVAGNGKPPPGWLGRQRYRTRLAGDFAEQLVRQTELLDVARRPAHEWLPAVAALPVPPDDTRHLLSHRQAATDRRLFEAAVRHQAVARTAALAVGCERFRLRHGRWPDTLADLPADLTPADATDPYSGRPLLLKRLPDGLAVYSVGPDAADDGGTRLGPPPATQSGQDIGFRLWDTSARGRPAGDQSP